MSQSGLTLSKRTEAEYRAQKLGPLTDYELHGPWTGNAIHVPPPPHRRSILKPILITWAIVAIAIGGLLALAGWGA